MAAPFNYEGSYTMGMYLDSGYLNFDWIYQRPFMWQLITGGRGTGKTYGALQYLYEHHIKFIYLRRTQAQADLVGRPDFSPFKILNTDMGWNVVAEPITKYNSGFYNGILDADSGKVKAAGAPIGYTAALSTFANIRGFDASDVDCILYDEFIPEKHERNIKHEFTALANAYETVARNRELTGRPPVKLICLSNSNDIANPVFTGLNLVNKIVKMVERGQTMYEDTRRGVGVYLLSNSTISAAKSDTALYRALYDSEFADMAIGNQFTGDRTSTVIRSRDLKQLKPVVSIGELCIYEIKGETRFYASLHKSGAIPEYYMTETDKERFKRNYYWVWLAYMDRCLECESYLAETVLQSVFKS